LVAIFGPRANLFMNAALIGAAGLLVFLLVLIWVVPVMGYNTEERYIPPQPVPFSHQHHVSGPRPRLPLLPHDRRGLTGRRHAADAHLHDLPFADLDQHRDACTSAAKPC
jgi:hypothetical protein